MFSIGLLVTGIAFGVQVFSVTLTWLVSQLPFLLAMYLGLVAGTAGFMPFGYALLRVNRTFGVLGDENDE